MAQITFLFFQCKTFFSVNSKLLIVFYPLGNFGQALCIRSCHVDLILTRKNHNCSGIAFIQGDSAGGLKLIEQTIQQLELLPRVDTTPHFLHPIGTQNLISKAREQTNEKCDLKWMKA